MTPDRRKHERLDLRLPVILSRAGNGTIVRTETRNISRDGFFCLTEEPFAPGERLRCLLLLPALSGKSTVPSACLEGDVEVIRIVTDEESGKFGIGCALHDYQLIPVPDVFLSMAQAAWTAG